MFLTGRISYNTVEWLLGSGMVPVFSLKSSITSASYLSGELTLQMLNRETGSLKALSRI